MKKLKLKESVKLTLMITGVTLFVIAIMFIYANRIEKINNGELQVVENSYMDR